MKSSQSSFSRALPSPELSISAAQTFERLDFRDGEWSWSPPPQMIDPPKPFTKFEKDSAYEYVNDSWQCISDPMRLRHLAEVSKRIVIAQ